jgi:hypothetical protein
MTKYYTFYSKTTYLHLIYSFMNYVMLCKVLGIKMVTGTYKDMCHFVLVSG